MLENGKGYGGKRPDLMTEAKVCVCERERKREREREGESE
jgi:hypothetical protein